VDEQLCKKGEGITLYSASNHNLKGYQIFNIYQDFPVSPKEKALTPAQALQNHHQKYIGMHIRKGGSNT
jgi:hypothetical protein